MLKFITSQKGTKKLVVGGFLFTKHRNGADGKEICRCEDRNCRVRIHTLNNAIIEEVGTHSHAVTHGRVSVEGARSEMKRQARETEEPSRRIVQRALLAVPVDDAHLLPARETLSRDFRRQRLKTRRIADGDDICRTTQEGNLFLRIEDDDMLVFAADDDLHFLQQCQHWFADGTFRVTPEGFDQLYTLHGFHNNSIFPCAYALLPGRSQAVYGRFLNHITTLSNVGQPLSIVTDFELAAVNAFKDKFPNATMVGCMFHFGQCIWRQVQQHGLAATYKNDPEFATKVKRLMALAFVPTADVIAAFEELTDDDDYRNMDVILDYFEDNFIMIQRRNRRAPLRLELTLWNQYDRVLNKLPRSNNAVEGWHNSFNNSVGIAHPTAIALSKKIKIEQHSMALFRRQLKLGQPQRKIRKTYKQVDEALFTIVSDYNNRDRMQYLTDISRVLRIDIV